MPSPRVDLWPAPDAPVARKIVPRTPMSRLDIRSPGLLSRRVSTLGQNTQAWTASLGPAIRLFRWTGTLDAHSCFQLCNSRADIQRVAVGYDMVQ